MSLPWGPMGGQFLMREVPLYPSPAEEVSKDTVEDGPLPLLPMELARAGDFL